MPKPNGMVPRVHFLEFIFYNIRVRVVLRGRSRQYNYLSTEADICTTCRQVTCDCQMRVFIIPRLAYADQ